MTSNAPPLCVVMACAAPVARRARYALDSLMMAAGIRVEYVSSPPTNGPWLLYGSSKAGWPQAWQGLAIACCDSAWAVFDNAQDATGVDRIQGLPVVAPGSVNGADADITFDLLANSFFFLSSWSERVTAQVHGSRRLYQDSVFKRLGLPQDIVDRYLEHLLSGLNALCARLGVAAWPAVGWPRGADFAVVLSHDVDFLPAGPGDIAVQGVKTFMRHLVRQRDPADALRSLGGLARACAAGRDPYGCIPHMLEQERRLGVRASYQVAVARRHAADVNYRIEDDRVRNYLRAIVEAGFDLCLHGSYRSTENDAWYEEEVELLASRLARPLGSRQHFLSFDIDRLFKAQERSGIEYDMSMGYPDQTGPRAGFSHPYFPYNPIEDRPYRVLQISLVLMDVTLRGYMNLRPDAAWPVIERELLALSRRRGCASAVWHPIVFAGARDPGYDRLFWRLVDHVTQNNGLATDGATVNRHWRERAAHYASFGAGEQRTLTADMNLPQQVNQR